MIGILGYAYIGIQDNKLVIPAILLSLMLSIVYIGMQYVVLNDPYWLVYGVNLFAAVPIVLLLLIMIKDVRIRIGVLLSAYVHGELGYGLFVNVPDIQVMGGELFLSHLSISGCILFLWTLYEKITTGMKVKMDCPKKHVKEGLH